MDWLTWLQEWGSLLATFVSLLFSGLLVALYRQQYKIQKSQHELQELEVKPQPKIGIDATGLPKIVLHNAGKATALDVYASWEFIYDKKTWTAPYIRPGSEIRFPLLTKEDADKVGIESLSSSQNMANSHQIVEYLQEADRGVMIEYEIMYRTIEGTVKRDSGSVNVLSVLSKSDLKYASRGDNGLQGISTELSGIQRSIEKLRK